MGRANRRKKIRKLLKRAKQKRLEEQRRLEDPETSTGQARCSVEKLEEFEVNRRVSREMNAEEVLVEVPTPPERPTRSWIQWVLSFVR